MEYEKETKRDRSVRHVIYQLECLMLALKDSPITCRLLTGEITKLARANYTRISESSLAGRLAAKSAEAAWSSSGDSQLIYDEKAAKYWQRVQETLKSDSPQFAANRKKSSLIRQTLFSLEDVLLTRCDAAAHKEMVDQCDALIDRFADRLQHMKFDSDLLDPDILTYYADAQGKDTTLRPSPQQSDHCDLSVQFQQSEAIVERAEEMLGLTDTFCTMGLPARLNGVLVAVKRISDRNALLEARKEDGIPEATLKEIQEALELRVQELVAQNTHFQDQLATGEELIRSLTEQQDFEHKQATPSRYLPTPETQFIMKEKEVLLPFEHAPLHCDRSVVQAILCFVTDPYPQYDSFCVMADSCMWPTTADLCPRARCVGCRRHEYRLDAESRLRGVCDDLLAMKIQSQDDEQEGSTNTTPDTPLDTNVLTEKERYGFEVEEEVRLWEQKLYVQWQRGPVASLYEALEPEDKESATLKALRRKIDLLESMSAMNLRDSDLSQRWATLPNSYEQSRLKAAEAELEKLRAATKLCLLQLQRLEAAVHPSRPVTYPDSRRAAETLESVPPRLLGVIQAVSELQKENNKLKREATDLEEIVAELQRALDRAEEEAAVVVQSPGESTSKYLGSTGSSSPVKKTPHSPLKMSSSSSRSRPALAKVPPSEDKLCSELVDELEKMLRNGTPAAASSAGTPRRLSTRLTCVVDGMRDLYFRDNNAEVERLNREVLTARDELKQTHKYYSFKHARREQLDDYEKQLEQVGRVLVEHQYVPMGCTLDKFVLSGEIPRYMRRMGVAHSAARTAIELMLQEGVDSKASDAALNVWSADSLDIVRSIKQVLTSHMWPAQEQQKQQHSASHPASPEHSADSQPSLEADEKISAAPSLQPCRRRMSHKDMVAFTRNAARNNPPSCTAPSWPHTEDHNAEQKSEFKPLRHGDAGEHEVQNTKMGADSKHSHQEEEKTCGGELDSDEERQVQYLLQEMYEEETLRAKSTITEAADPPGALLHSVSESSAMSANTGSLNPPQGPCDLAGDAPAEMQERASDVSATGSDGEAGFVVI